MLNAADPQTITSLRLLKHTIEASSRPIVFWIGAGASRWLGYQSWQDLARSMRRHFFLQHIPGFSNHQAAELIESGRLPKFFQLCKAADPGQYNRLLVEAFTPKPDTSEYSRFVDLLLRLAPDYLLTTNIDEALENRLHKVSVVQRTDLSRCPQLIGEGSSFLAKLHGTCSAIETAVFTEHDYSSLIKDESYMQLIKYVFATCTVVFLGYGVADDYVLTLLQRTAKEMSLFGLGPHFVVTDNEQKTIDGVHRIAYETKRYRDHRAAMTILDYIWQSKQRVQERGFLVPVNESDRVPAQALSSSSTGYYISDFSTPEFFTSATAEHEMGMTIDLTLGLGFAKEELPYVRDGEPYIVSALHDLIVGLICFDRVYIPLLAAGTAHQLLQAEKFWRLVESECLYFVHVEHEPAVIRPTGELFGDFSLITIRGEDKTTPRSVSEVIRRQITSAPGKEAEGERLLYLAEERTVTFRDGARLEIASLVRNALLMPGIAALLGVSDAILPSQTPKWLTFPYLEWPI